METEQKLKFKGAVRFPCPGCGQEIVRTPHERKIAAKYRCPKCEFEGPN